MAVPAETVQTNTRVGIREDLTDLITNISPTEYPVMSTMPTGKKATNVNHEWQTDELAAADGDNKHLQGDDSTGEASPATVRLGNYTQIMKKVASVSETANTVNTAGRTSELAYQVAKKAEELKRDMETRIAGASPKAAPTDSVEGELAGVECWLTNSSRGNTGTDPSPVDGSDAPGDGTQRAFTEAMLKAVHKTCWDEGGNPTVLVVGSFNKQAASGFSGIATQYRDNQQVGAATIIAAADIYVGDFGQISIVPSRFSRARSALLLEPRRWEINYLRNPRNRPLARTGDALRRDVVVEFTISCLAPKANGIVADLTTS